MYGVRETHGELTVVNKLGHKIPCDYVIYADGHMVLKFQDIDTAKEIIQDLMAPRPPELKITVPTRVRIVND